MESLTNRETLLEMLQAEDKIRRSQEIQELYDQLKNNLELENVLQKNLLQSFGFEPTEENLLRYRRTRVFYADDQEIKNAVMYIKYDIMKKGDLRINDLAPDINLYHLDGSQTNLLEFMKQDRPLIVVGSSSS